MKPGLFQQLMLYRYRYAVAYTLMALFGGALLIWQLSTLGPGLSSPEQASALHSAAWQWQNWQTAGLQIVNLPYVLLQKASIAQLGLSTLSIRLPSVAIALVASVMFVLLARLLFRPHTATVASVMFVVSSWYVAIARFGAPYIMIVLIWVLATYAFVRLIRLDKSEFGWAALAAFAAALALYTPSGIYAIIAGLFVVLVHPEARRKISGLTGPQVVLGIFVLVPLLIPLGWGLYKDPSQAWQLAGLTSQLPNATDFAANLKEALAAIVWRAPQLPELRLGRLPLLSVGVAALLLAGIYRSIRDWRAMRVQFVLGGVLLSLLVTGLNPQEKSYALLIVPLYLLVASGVSVLFREWYKLFPRNPYARSFALIPITIFLGLIVSYSYQRYFVAWARAPQTFSVYNDDLSLVRQQITKDPSLALVVNPEEAQWYKLLQRHNPDLTVTTTPLESASTRTMLTSDTDYAAATQTTTHPRTYTPIVNDYRSNALRFWLVK